MRPLEGIDLLSYQSTLRLEKDAKGSTRVFDPLRKSLLVATPEEIVRQLWIHYLTEILGLNKKLIAVERSFSVNGLPRRFDLVVFTKDTRPLLLAELKAPGVNITQSTFDQIAQYNMSLQVPYSLISNGIQHYCFKIDDEEKKFQWEERLPFK